jgi:hypothetical protein
VGPRAGVDNMEKRKSLLPGIAPWPSSLYTVAIPTELLHKLRFIFQHISHSFVSQATEHVVRVVTDAC